MSETLPSLLTVKQFSQKHTAFPEGGMRHRIFHADKNGFDRCVRRVGAKVLIDETEFFRWITGPRFDNDNDYDLQSQQHDCYWEVLAVIAERCIRHYEAACKITGVEPSVLSKNIGQEKTGFDHRVLQPVHDLMAGYWRWHTGRHEPHMPGLEPNGIPDWKAWVRQEVDDWALYAPEIVRHVVIALAQQNADEGYEAENMAQDALKNRYGAMLDV